MIYKTYGRTGAEFSAVGFGGMRFDVSRSNEENAELLLYARDKGINYFDTAPDYCQDRSEPIFGIALRQMARQREQITVSTKRMPDPHDDFAAVRADVQQSLDRLGLDYIDVYHVWCTRSLEQYALAMRPGGLYESLRRLKEDGSIRHLAISTHLPGTEIRRIIDDGAFEGVLLGVNVLNFQFRWPGVKAAHEAGWGVVAMNPLAGGLIPQNHRALSFLAREGDDPTTAALRFCVGCPEITVTLVGFTKREHIDTACRVAESARPFTADDLEAVRRHLSQNMDVLCTGCGYCDGLCPRNVPVPSYMQFYNDRLLMHKTDAQMVEHTRFHHGWGLLHARPARAADCTACGRCEQACTQHLPIIRRLEEIAAWEARALGESNRTD